MSRAKNPKIVALIAEAQKDSEDVGILRIYNEIKKLGKQDRLWHVRRIPIKRVGVHRKNRGGFFVSGPTCHIIGGTVMGVGYDPDAHRDATSFQEGPDRLNEKKFLETVENDALLASFNPGDIESSSVGCSHFNQFLAATIDGVPSDVKALTIDGRLSKAKLINRYPDMEVLFTEGLEWIEWFHEAELLYPELPDICQRGLNAKYAAQQDEHWGHQYQRAVTVLNTKEAIASGDPVAYTTRDLLKSKPKCAADIPAIVDFAYIYGGTDISLFCEPLMRFIKAHMAPGRVVPVGVWKTMAGLKLEPEDFCPHFMHSVLFILASSPAKSAPSNIAKIVGSGDINGLAKGRKLADMKAAEKVIKDAIHTFAKLDLTANNETKILGELRTALAGKVFGKIKSVEDQSMHQLAVKFFLEGKAHQRSSEEVEHPWGDQIVIEDPEPTPPSDNRVPGSYSSVEYSTDGTAVGIYIKSLLNRGFEANCFIKDKEGGIRET